MAPYTKYQIRKFLINHSLLNSKAKNIYEVLERLTCIQVDPINVIARNHELALFNRVENFKLSDLEKALYKDRTLFEYWLQLFSIIPMKYFPYLKARRDDSGRWQHEYYKKHKKEIEQVYEYIKEHGPTTPKDLNHIKRVKNLFAWNNKDTRTGSLEYMWDIGTLMIHHREKNQKVYDLTEKVAVNYLDNEITIEESLEFIVKSAFYYLGIVRKAFIKNRLGYTKGKELIEKFNELLDKGEIVKLAVEGVSTDYYTLKEFLPELEEIIPSHKGINILPPLDPLVIDRKMLKDIFDFDYIWEAYTPPLKRKFGFYGKPILYKGEFIGQIALRKDKDKKIVVENIQVKKYKSFDSELNKYIKRLSDFVK